MKYFIVTFLLSVAYARRPEHLVSVSGLNEIAEQVNENPSSTWQVNLTKKMILTM